MIGNDMNHSCMRLLSSGAARYNIQKWTKQYNNSNNKNNDSNNSEDEHCNGDDSSSNRTINS